MVLGNSLSQVTKRLIAKLVTHSHRCSSVIYPNEGACVRIKDDSVKINVISGNKLDRNLRLKQSFKELIHVALQFIVLVRIFLLH